MVSSHTHTYSHCMWVCVNKQMQLLTNNNTTLKPIITCRLTSTHKQQLSCGNSALPWRWTGAELNSSCKYEALRKLTQHKFVKVGKPFARLYPWGMKSIHQHHLKHIHHSAVSFHRWLWARLFLCWQMFPWEQLRVMEENVPGREVQPQ